MNRFFEVIDRTYGKQMINLDNVEILSEKSYEVVMTGGKRFKIIKESFEGLLNELKSHIQMLRQRRCVSYRMI